VVSRYKEWREWVLWNRSKQQVHSAINNMVSSFLDYPQCPLSLVFTPLINPFPVNEDLAHREAYGRSNDISVQKLQLTGSDSL
jgi:hypothetical protein